MDSKIPLKILKEKARLEKLIRTGAPYTKICKKSEQLDKLILIQFRHINKNHEEAS